MKRPFETHADHLSVSMSMSIDELDKILKQNWCCVVEHTRSFYEWDDSENAEDQGCENALSLSETLRVVRRLRLFSTTQQQA